MSAIITCSVMNLGFALSLMTIVFVYGGTEGKRRILPMVWKETLVLFLASWCGESLCTTWVTSGSEPGDPDGTALHQ